LGGTAIPARTFSIGRPLLQSPPAAKIVAMNLIINGDTQTWSADTLSALVDQLGMKSDRVAVELNREIVPRDQWPYTRLSEGDRLEIVHFVGGGSHAGL
jgi:sulfur carrier protein